MDIAVLTFDPKTKRLIKINFFREDLRFKCQRCAVFCCKLGGPTLCDKDMRRLRKSCADTENIVESAKDNVRLCLREAEDGSCALLICDDKSKKYTCSVYSFRPSLCRLYPFEFIFTGPTKGVLRTIPLCNGLNAVDGELVDRKFVEKNLLGPIVNTLNICLSSKFPTSVNFMVHR